MFVNVPGAIFDEAQSFDVINLTATRNDTYRENAFLFTATLTRNQFEVFTYRHFTG